DLALREFSIAIASVGTDADATDDPLTRIPAQVQHQVANAVRLFVGPPPDLLVTEFLQAVFDLRQEVFRQMVARTRDESLADIAHQLSSAESIVSGRCLCLALRPAGRAFSSGLACVRGCPGGGSGRT